MLTAPVSSAFAEPYEQIGGILPLCTHVLEVIGFSSSIKDICCQLPSSNERLIAFLHHQTVVQSVNQPLSLI